MKNAIISQAFMKSLLRGILGIGCITFSMMNVSAQNQMNEMWGEQSIKKMES